MNLNIVLEVGQVFVSWLGLHLFARIYFTFFITKKEASVN